jgi:hypothetical protein
VRATLSIVERYGVEGSRGSGEHVPRPIDPAAVAPRSADALEEPLGGLRLEARQRRLLEALEAKDRLLGDLYRSGLEILDRDDLPDHAALVSHEFRELMEKLPKSFDLPVRRPLQLRVRVRELAASLDRAKEVSGSHDGERWDGPIDDALRGFLMGADSWFEEVAAELRSRREAAKDFLFADQGVPLPAILERQEIEKWNELEVFFQSVSHHGRSCTERELATSVGDLEALLIGRLKLAVAEEYDEIDRLIEEGEGHA